MSAFNATAIALELGNVKLVNTVMLGAVAEALPFSAEHLLEGIVSRFRQSKPHLVALRCNTQSFYQFSKIYTISLLPLQIHTIARVVLPPCHAYGSIIQQ